jgi:hypothetical protein
MCYCKFIHAQFWRMLRNAKKMFDGYESGLRAFEREHGSIPLAV